MFFAHCLVPMERPVSDIATQQNYSLFTELRVCAVVPQLNLNAKTIQKKNVLMWPSSTPHKCSFPLQIVKRSISYPVGQRGKPQL